MHRSVRTMAERVGVADSTDRRNTSSNAARPCSRSMSPLTDDVGCWGFEVGGTESQSFWSMLLHPLEARELGTTKVVTRDASLGWIAAIATAFDGPSWKGCLVHSGLPRVRDCHKRCTIPPAYRTPTEWTNLEAARHFRLQLRTA